MDFYHLPIMLNECIDGLNIRPDGDYLDCTLGGGGHSAEILRRLNGTGHLYGIDRDNDALAAATERLGAAGNFTAVKGNFHDVKALLAERGVEKIDGMISFYSPQTECSDFPAAPSAASPTTRTRRWTCAWIRISR